MAAPKTIFEPCDWCHERLELRKVWLDDDYVWLCSDCRQDANQGSKIRIQGYPRD